ncbi:hypothetical protein KC19_VG148000 [Ceratodon purpureus]|uniref:Uncharacterized protein n=1 Tax=Ceratodon purpureus TaxID=3225 RepID=A0A8T0HQ92_CERPU|nr:hypothetical protein KC19_VG148000 [Ceratodon purpureus]
MRAPARAAMADQVGLGFTRARCGTSAEGQWFTASMFVYYCYDEEGGVAQFIAEVTNTPSAERAIDFFFALGLDLVDMEAVWQMQAAAFGQELLMQNGV